MANDPYTAVGHLPLLFKPHPWHGIPIGDDAPREVTCFIEIVPTDTVKYELDKETGYLKVDRPQQFSNLYPCLYGFIPQTYCGEQVGAFCGARTGRVGIVGDRDPLDICVMIDRPIPRGDILVPCVPIGGLGISSEKEFAVGSMLLVRPVKAIDLTPWCQIEVLGCRSTGAGWRMNCRFVNAMPNSVLLLFG